MRQNIELTVSCNLCTSCGICKGICPKECISFRYRDGMYFPSVNDNECVNCGICVKTCPGINKSYPDMKASIDALYGSYRDVYNAWSKDPVLRHVSASGGVITSIIKTLLEQQIYDIAFVLDTYSGREQIKTVPFEKKDIPNDWKEATTPKSRYLPVSHEGAILYVKRNPDKRVIFVGTSCAISGIKKAIEVLNRDSTQYLCIGLFCDSVFNYQITNYFRDILCLKKNIHSLHFKNKESGGWPGNLKFFYEDGSYEYKDKSNRSEAKQFFMPECCLYCIDKLNINADISVGDNYTDQNYSELGSNSVIVRTLAGKNAWDVAKMTLEYATVEIDKLREAQFIDGRLNNLYFGALKERSINNKSKERVHLNKGISLVDSPFLYEQAWKKALARINAGAKYDYYQQLRIPKQNKFMNLLQKFYYKVKRSICKWT